MIEPTRKRPSILRTSVSKATNSPQASTSAPTTTVPTVPVNPLQNLPLDGSGASSISFVNLTGDVIQLVSVSSDAPNGNDGTGDGAGQPKPETVIRLAPSTATILSTAEAPPAPPAPSAPRNPTPVTPMIRTSVRSCCVCETSTNNKHAGIITCTKCETVFHRLFDNLGEVRDKCDCSNLPSACSNCRLYKSATKALSKWGTKLTDRARREWSIIDRSLAALTKTDCTLDDIFQVNEEELGRVYGPPIITFPLKLPQRRGQSSSDLDGPSAAGTKRIAVDSRFWIPAAQMVPIATPLVASTSTSISVAPSTSQMPTEPVQVVTKLDNALAPPPLPPPKTQNKAAVQPPLTLSPTAALSSALTDDDILARRLSRLIRASFSQVYTKHCGEPKKAEPLIADIAMDNHATLIHLFDFYDWEWNQPVEVSEVVRQACWSAFHEQFNESLTDMVRFIKRIPGFPILKPQDRILLVRQSGFELAFVVHYLNWNTNHGTWHGLNNFVLTLDQLVTIFPSGNAFFNHAFSNAERLSVLQQQLQHLGLMAALIVLNADIPSLSDRKTVDDLRQRMLNAMKFGLEARQRDTEMIMKDVEEALHSLRTLGNAHRTMLERFREEDHLEFPDDLYAELFELISD
ncbi:nuclear receptor subfamily 1 group D member 3 [Clonorchis sinensis]|uniref:Nuclear receptor subfamily 1 group D member 3 n=1 Tax=Clonorchis sinensis TaxID=79923 RepID=G7YWX7_CLOSI|nr:nuclear receptor subfamily 1 group D member 3 [Clonorchis sinensis]